MHWSKPTAATLSAIEQWIQTYIQAKTHFQRAGQLVNANGHCEEARVHYAAAKELFLALVDKQPPRGLSYHSRIDSEGRTIQAYTFPIDALQCLAHSSMSGYAEAQDYLDQAEKMIGYGFVPGILAHLREAVLPFKQKNQELKQKLQMERQVLFENDQEIRNFHKDFARARAHSNARQEMEQRAVQSRQADFPVEDEDTAGLDRSLWHELEHHAPLFFPPAPLAPSFTTPEQSNAMTVTSPAPVWANPSYPPDWLTSYAVQEPFHMPPLESGPAHGLGIYQNFHAQARHHDLHEQGLYQNLRGQAVVQEFPRQAIYQSPQEWQSLGPSYGASTHPVFSGPTRPGPQLSTEYGDFWPAGQLNAMHPQNPSTIYRPDPCFLENLF